MTGAAITGATVLLVTALALLVRHRRPAVSRLMALSALLFIITLLVWWIVIFPVNVELTYWAGGAVPSNWGRIRIRWETAQGAIAIIQLVAFAALVGSVLADGAGDRTTTTYRRA
jgi:hypothetical protein